MHTTVLFEAPEGKLVMIHNSDFSGDAFLRRTAPGREAVVWELPGWVIMEIRKNAIAQVLEWMREFPSLEEYLDSG